MLINLLKEVEQTINSMEHPQKDKDNFYRYIDELVQNLLNEKLEKQYFANQRSSFKGTDSERCVNLYEGYPREEENDWQWSKNKPSINIWYKIKLKSIDVRGSWNNYKQYTLKEFSIVTEYNDYEFELQNKFREMEESSNEHFQKRKQELFKSKDEFIIFLESLKQSIVNGEDIAETRRETNYSWRDGVEDTQDKFKKLLDNYAELMKTNKNEQE